LAVSILLWSPLLSDIVNDLLNSLLDDLDAEMYHLVLHGSSRGTQMLATWLVLR